MLIGCLSLILLIKFGWWVVRVGCLLFKCVCVVDICSVLVVVLLGLICCGVGYSCLLA